MHTDIQTTYNQATLDQLRQLGKDGALVSEAAPLLGVSVAAYLKLEQTVPSFQEAAASVRANTTAGGEMRRAWRAYRALRREMRARLKALRSQQCVQGVPGTRVKKRETILPTVRCIGSTASRPRAPTARSVARSPSGRRRACVLPREQKGRRARLERELVAA
jgi:hypothetical protein